MKTETTNTGNVSRPLAMLMAVLMMFSILAMLQMPAQAKGDDTDAFVEMLYEDVLGRKAGKGEIAIWADAIRGGGIGGADTARGIFLSAEGNALGDLDFVTVLYALGLGRASAPAEAAQWAAGLAPGGGWTRTTMLDAFLGMQGFANLCARYGVVLSMDPAAGVAAAAVSADDFYSDEAIRARLYELNMDVDDVRVLVGIEPNNWLIGKGMNCGEFVSYATTHVFGNGKVNDANARAKQNTYSRNVYNWCITGYWQGNDFIVNNVHERDLNVFKSVIRVGDVIDYMGSVDKYGRFGLNHVMMVLSVDDKGITVAEGGYNPKDGLAINGGSINFGRRVNFDFFERCDYLLRVTTYRP